jgi:hypothetical protein
MKKIIFIMLILVFGLSQFVMAGNDDRAAKTNWEAFSANLVKALATDNEGLRLSAMQHVITYHQNLKVNAAVFDLVRIYRLHHNQRVRQLAVVTLYHIGDDWAMNFLKRNLRFEENPTIRRQILDGLNDGDNITTRSVELMDIAAAK